MPGGGGLGMPRWDESKEFNQLNYRLFVKWLYKVSKASYQ